ncbi:MAG: 2-amino-4-hydroxy-6-hydroxymethyldihydropteridine diphosphokinase [Elusimicrobia bacterium]|nr:2-amino-4-hydroxy-6-hydroxymethyldihydropteridine diphosphokinase [Elusimicrobiota bacterium]
MSECLLALGSNLGRRRANLLRALRRLEGLPGGRVLARSRFYDTAPEGGARQPRYLNLAARYRTSLSPMGLLVELKRLEAKAGRRPGRRRGSRPLDIDMLDFAGRRLRNPWLALPHPQAARRAFVLAPVRDIRPDWRPDGRRSAARLLQKLRPSEREVRALP